MEYICNQYPQEDWTHVFTDGSATEATRDGGAGIFLRYKRREKKKLQSQQGNTPPTSELNEKPL
ncbi:hypothetical protein BaRGS_00040139, partial [Batillaria attramentaria]